MKNALFDKLDILAALCKAKAMWGMYLSIPPNTTMQEIINVAPFLKGAALYQFFFYEEGFIFTSSEEEIYELFHQLVGSSPASNPYNKDCIIYALVCSPSGEIQTENV